MILFEAFDTDGAGKVAAVAKVFLPCVEACRNRRVAEARETKPFIFFYFPATFQLFGMSNEAMTDDRTLVSRVLHGDMQAFMQLISQHERLVVHMVGRLVRNGEDREELCQDVFVKVYENLGKFTFQSKLSTWIATIAYRHAINHLRKKKIFFTDIREEERFTNKFVETSNPETITEEVDMDELIQRSIDELPPHYKVVLTLYHVEGLSYPEIREVTKMPEGTVKNYLFRARNLLKEKVKKYLGKEEIS